MKLKNFLELTPKERAKLAERLALKGYAGDLEYITELAKKHNSLAAELDQARAEHNRLAKEQNIEAGRTAAIKVGELEAEFRQVLGELTPLWQAIPNPPDKDVPTGGEENNQVIGQSKLQPTPLAVPKDHVELGEKLDIIDIERGVKTSGSRFYFLKNEGVELEFALIKWLFKLLRKKGFDLLVGPQIVNEEVMVRAGYISKSDRHAGEVYRIDNIDTPDRTQYLIGTSEQSMLGYHMDEIIDVPKRYAAFSTCFRREAGSYGKDVKGIIRTHQFDKVEMFSFVRPNDSDKELKKLVAIEEFILKKLELPYQKVLIAAGDLGMPAAKKFDLECWLPSQGCYRETHSCSNCTDWQANRANIRYRDEKGETASVHTLNGTALAIGRILVAILENHQQPDGSITIPKVLQSYAGFKEIRVRDRK
ncbi:TPA: serine--tRNA ligase [Patescibacteria group bacterium]|nr:serine--tRNA ligase [Patescibacteria group bacterium]